MSSFNTFWITLLKSMCTRNKISFSWYAVIGVWSEKLIGAHLCWRDFTWNPGQCQVLGRYRQTKTKWWGLRYVQDFFTGLMEADMFWHQHLRGLCKDVEAIWILAKLMCKREAQKLKQAQVIHEAFANILFEHIPQLRVAFEIIIAYVICPNVSKSDVPDYYHSSSWLSSL